tara:strand:- start:1021 stop:2013 length:993 start_codon:yes stop_codon:yes gene_type:complete
MGDNSNDRLGIVLSTATDGSPQDFVEIAQLAETNGYDSVFVNEGRGDALACAEAIALGTKKLNIGTNIANIYFRHPFSTASTARTIGELSSGRFILGLGISHRSMLASLGIDMGNAREVLQNYVESTIDSLQGRARLGFFRAPAAKYPVPLYVAGNTVETAIIAGTYANGLMPFLTPVSHLPVLLDAAKNARSAAQRNNASFGCILSVPTFVSEDEIAARSAARYNLAFFAQLPNYRRQWRRAGFKKAMDSIQAILKTGTRREAARQIPNELVDEVCVFGTPINCHQRLKKFRDAGVDTPLLAVSPVNDDRLGATRKTITALSPSSQSCF